MRWSRSHLERDPCGQRLKSSSTAANAAVLATLDAMGEEMDLIEAAKIGVAAAREAGETITGALDDALASMLGGAVVTDNRNMKLLKRDRPGIGRSSSGPGKKALLQGHRHQEDQGSSPP